MSGWTRPEVPEDLRERLASFKAKADALAAAADAREFLQPTEHDGHDACLVCAGAGWTVTAEGRYRKCWCEEARRPAAEGVPYEFQRIRLGTWQERPGQAAAVKACVAFAGAGRDLYLTGGVGGGKTALACATLNELNRALPGLFVRVPMALYQLQRGDEHADFERALMTRQLVVLDDLGAERDQATDYTRRTLLMLYEARHDANRRTIFTSNKTIAQLAAMQDDDRLASRIAGWADVVSVTTADQRIIRRVK